MSQKRRNRSVNEQLIIDKVNAVDFYNTMVVPLASKFRVMSEGRATGLCPFHHDTDPSFHYWKKRNIFHCFGCGTSGDVIRIYRLLRKAYWQENVTVEQAVRQLATAFGIELVKEEENEVTTPFTRARMLLLDREALIIPSGTMSIAQFRKLNNQVRLSNLTPKQKVYNYGNLDLAVSLFLSQNN